MCVQHLINNTIYVQKIDKTLHNIQIIPPPNLEKKKKNTFTDLFTEKC